MKKLKLNCGVLTWVFLLVVGLSCGSVFAKGTEPFEGLVVDQIKIQGLKRIADDAIINKIISKPGTALSPEKLRVDVKNLYTMGYFDDIEWLGEKVQVSGTTKVTLTLKVKERPAISKIEFEGNEHQSDTELEGVIKVKTWSILDMNKIREDVALLTKHYEDKGYYLTKISYEVRDGKAGEVELKYRVQDYEKVKIKKITFLGNKKFTDEQLKAVLAETREGNFFSGMSNAGNFKEGSFKTDLQRLLYFYLDKGYVKFKHDSPVVTISDDKTAMYISIHVEEGEVYDIGKIDFSGDLLFSREELAEPVTLTTGTTFSILKRNADIQTISEKYQDLGYAFANVVPKMDIHDETKTVDLDYQIEKGNLAYFGEITVVGNTKTHDKVIRRELKIFEGELYNGTRLRKSKENVERLGFFQPGEVLFNTSSPKGRTDIVNLEIQIKERSTGTVTLSAGYGALQGVFVQAQVAEANLLGKGQNVSTQASVAKGRRNNALILGFTDPYAFDTRWSAGADLFYSTNFIPFKYITRKLGAAVRLGHPIGDYTYGFITYKRENLKIEELNIPEPDAFDLSEIELDKGSLSSIVWSVIRDKRNNRFETTGGNYQSVSLETAGLGGEKKFIKYSLNNRFYQKVFGDLTFRHNLEVGSAFSLDSNGVPPSERFYLGGPNNLKGYQFFTIGPSRQRTLSTGAVTTTPLGGNYQFFGNFELEQYLVRDAGLKFVTFYDFGNVFQTSSDFKQMTIRQDWGFGIRWFSPIGPLRFEWGFPLAKRPGEDSVVFQFMIGPPF